MCERSPWIRRVRWMLRLLLPKSRISVHDSMIYVLWFLSSFLGLMKNYLVYPVVLYVYFYSHFALWKTCVHRHMLYDMVHTFSFLFFDFISLSHAIHARTQEQPTPASNLSCLHGW